MAKKYVIDDYGNKFEGMTKEEILQSIGAGGERECVFTGCVEYNNNMINYNYTGSKPDDAILIKLLEVGIDPENNNLTTQEITSYLALSSFAVHFYYIDTEIYITNANKSYLSFNKLGAGIYKLYANGTKTLEYYSKNQLKDATEFLPVYETTFNTTYTIEQNVLSYAYTNFKSKCDKKVISFILKLNYVGRNENYLITICAQSTPNVKIRAIQLYSTTTNIKVIASTLAISSNYTIDQITTDMYSVSTLKAIPDYALKAEAAKSLTYDAGSKIGEHPFEVFFETDEDGYLTGYIVAAREADKSDKSDSVNVNNTKSWSSGLDVSSTDGVLVSSDITTTSEPQLALCQFSVYSSTDGATYYYSIPIYIDRHTTSNLNYRFSIDGILCAYYKLTSSGLYIGLTSALASGDGIKLMSIKTIKINN